MERLTSSAEGISEPSRACAGRTVVRSRLSRISLTPNRPMATGTSATPSISSRVPNVKRGAPITGSIPTIAIRSPATPESSARTREPLASPVTSDRPSTISAKYSGGPNRRAIEVSGSASRTRPMVATVPAKNEPIAAIASAGPARPCLAIS